MIVTLGRFSMARFFPGAKISVIHGQAKLIEGRIVVAMYHPAAALRTDVVMKAIEQDFQRAIPAALAEARRLAAEGKIATNPSASPSEDEDSDAPPLQQLSLF